VTGPKAAERLTVELDGSTTAFEHHLFRFRSTTAETLLSATDEAGRSQPLLTSNRYGEGVAYYYATPLLSAHGKQAVPMELMREIFDVLVPTTQRQVTYAGPETVEVVLRQQGSARVLHLVNLARGDREVVAFGKRQYVTIGALPKVPLCRVSIQSPQRPTRITLQPQGTPLADWHYNADRVEAAVPEFAVHQMVVLEYGDDEER
jgi:hypothetical protein